MVTLVKHHCTLSESPNGTINLQLSVCMALVVHLLPWENWPCVQPHSASCPCHRLLPSDTTERVFTEKWTRKKPEIDSTFINFRKEVAIVFFTESRQQRLPGDNNTTPAGSWRLAAAASYKNYFLSNTSLSNLSPIVTVRHESLLCG